MSTKGQVLECEVNSGVRVTRRPSQPLVIPTARVLFRVQRSLS